MTDSDPDNTVYLYRSKLEYLIKNHSNKQYKFVLGDVLAYQNILPLDCYANSICNFNVITCISPTNDYKIDSIIEKLKIISHELIQGCNIIEIMVLMTLTENVILEDNAFASIKNVLTTIQKDPTKYISINHTRHDPSERINVSSYFNVVLSIPINDKTYSYNLFGCYLPPVKDNYETTTLPNGGIGLDFPNLYNLISNRSKGDYTAKKNIIAISDTSVMKPVVKQQKVKTESSSDESSDSDIGIKKAGVRGIQDRIKKKRNRNQGKNKPKQGHGTHRWEQYGDSYETDDNFQTVFKRISNKESIQEKIYYVYDKKQVLHGTTYGSYLKYALRNHRKSIMAFYDKKNKEVNLENIIIKNKKGEIKYPTSGGGPPKFLPSLPSDTPSSTSNIKSELLNPIDFNENDFDTYYTKDAYVYYMHTSIIQKLTKIVNAFRSNPDHSVFNEKINDISFKDKIEGLIKKPNVFLPDNEDKITKIYNSLTFLGLTSNVSEVEKFPILIKPTVNQETEFAVDLKEVFLDSHKLVKSFQDTNQKITNLNTAINEINDYILKNKYLHIGKRDVDKESLINELNALGINTVSTITLPIPLHVYIITSPTTYEAYGYAGNIFKLPTFSMSSVNLNELIEYHTKKVNKNFYYDQKSVIYKIEITGELPNFFAYNSDDFNSTIVYLCPGTEFIIQETEHILLESSKSKIKHQKTFINLSCNIDKKTKFNTYVLNPIITAITLNSIDTTISEVDESSNNDDLDSLQNQLNHIANNVNHISISFSKINNQKSKLSDVAENELLDTMINLFKSTLRTMGQDKKFVFTKADGDNENALFNLMLKTDVTSDNEAINTIEQLFENEDVKTILAELGSTVDDGKYIDLLAFNSYKSTFNSIRNTIHTCYKSLKDKRTKLSQLNNVETELKKVCANVLKICEILRNATDPNNPSLNCTEAVNTCNMLQILTNMPIQVEGAMTGSGKEDDINPVSNIIFYDSYDTDTGLTKYIIPYLLTDESENTIPLQEPINNCKYINKNYYSFLNEFELNSNKLTLTTGRTIGEEIAFSNKSPMIAVGTGRGGSSILMIIMLVIIVVVMLIIVIINKCMQYSSNAQYDQLQYDQPQNYNTLQWT